MLTLVFMLCLLAQLFCAHMCYKSTTNESRVPLYTTMKRKSTESWIEDVDKASNARTIFLLIKGFLGTAVIFLPKAFYAGGMLPSTLMMGFSAIISGVASCYLVNAAAVIPGTYQDIAGVLYGPKFKKLVLMSIGIGQLCFSMTYILFISSNAKDLISTITGCKVDIDVSLLILAEFIVFIPMILMRQVRSLALIAMAGNFCMIGAIIYILYNDVIQLGSHKIEPKYTSDISGVIMIFNVSLLVFSAIGLLIPIRQASAEPLKMPRFIWLTLAFIFMLCTTVGIMSALAFGSSTETIVLLNLPNGILLQILQFGYIFAITVSVPLQMFPAFEIFEANLFPNPSLGHKSTKRQELQRSALRVVIMILTCFVAYMFASVLDLFVSLVGAFICIPLTFIYPPLLHLKATKTKGLGNKLMLGFAVVAMVVSTGITVKNMLSGQKDEQINRCLEI